MNKHYTDLKDSDIKELTLNILKEVKRVCDSLHINYYLAYGTLLGAVRHQGFIPWDDDIDIFLLRKDYETLLSSFDKIADKRYKVFSARQNENGCFPFAKIIDTHTEICEEYAKPIPGGGLGLFVDLFPLDFFPIEKKEQKYLLKKINWYWRYGYLTKRKDYPEMKWWLFTLYMSMPFPKPIFFKKKANEINIEFDNFITQKTQEINSDKLRMLMTAPDAEVEYEYNDFKTTVDMQFEDIICKAPVGYKHILEKAYGDYMTPPPVSKRTRKHYKYAYLIEQ